MIPPKHTHTQTNVSTNTTFPLLVFLADIIKVLDNRQIERTTLKPTQEHESQSHLSRKTQLACISIITIPITISEYYTQPHIGLGQPTSSFYGLAVGYAKDFLKFLKFKIHSNIN